MCGHFQPGRFTGSGSEEVKTIYIKMHSTESRFVIGPSNKLFDGMYVNTFQPGHLTGSGSEGVKTISKDIVSS